jgi:hypothetical protein
LPQEKKVWYYNEARNLITYIGDTTMKQLLIVGLCVLIFATIGMAQTGTSLKTDGGTQGVTSGMAHGPHDFTITASDSIGQKLIGATDFLCGYCHVPHISSSGIAVPLWARKSLKTGGTHAGIYFGKYSSGTMDAVVDSVTTDDNYSSFCISCHDGSQMFASSAYVSKPIPYSANASWNTGRAAGFDTVRIPSYMSMATTGSYGGLSHIHPVNFTYNAALATVDKGLYTPESPTYAHMSSTYGAVGRLFGGKMQCSSCHNPHISETYNAGTATNGSYPLIEGTLFDGTDGSLCVSCHKK